MQAFYTCFLKFCLALNSYKKTKSGLFKQPLFCYTIIVMNIGVWRSLVARSAGGREVAGSNPVTPTVKSLIIQGLFVVLLRSA